MKEIYLISGGRRSGKSNLAEKIARNYKKVIYIALSESRPNDSEWQSRITKHKLRRPEEWETIETDELLTILKTKKNTLLIDSIGGFVTKGLSMQNNEWEDYKRSLIVCLLNYENNLIIVGEQVGWGLVSEYEIGNLFADRLGEIINEITNIATKNWITINGKALRLDNIFIDI
mgnify:CR=1 FL=1